MVWIKLTVCVVGLVFYSSSFFGSALHQLFKEIIYLRKNIAVFSNGWSFLVINSSSPGDQAAPHVTTEESSPITESVADTVSRVVDGLQQSLGEGCSSSTSSDSLSSIVGANIIGIATACDAGLFYLCSILIWFSKLCHYFYVQIWLKGVFHGSAHVQAYQQLLYFIC